MEDLTLFPVCLILEMRQSQIESTNNQLIRKLYFDQTLKDGITQSLGSKQTWKFTYEAGLV